MSTDLKLMANEMMSNAVNYMLNQWKSLENFIKDGRVQISNNLCEQRMKPVKLNLKNCQNIGSENAAENTAFVFSLTESCRFNGINPETYLEKLFKCIVSKETYDKRQLLPVDGAYDFMRKSFNPHYSIHPVGFDLRDADEVVFFGPSLGDNDYHYFQLFLNINVKRA